MIGVLMLLMFAVPKGTWISVLCCRCMQPCTGQDIVASPSGVAITSQTTTYTVKSYVKVYIVLQQEDVRVYQAWQTTIARIRQMIPQSEMSPAHQRELLGKVQRMHDLLEKYHTPSKLSPRAKRGLFNFIGDAASTLFGTPSASDLKKLKEANQQLADAVDGVARTQQSIIGRVNKLGQAQSRIVNYLKELHQEITSTTLLIARINEREKAVFAYVWANEQVNELRYQMTEYLKIVDQMRDVRSACESNSHSELTISTSVLNQILSHAYTGSIEKIYSYYQYVSTERIIQVGSQLYCVANIPIAYEEADIEYQINTFPVCSSAGCFRLYENTRVVLNQRSGDLYFPEICFGHSPKMCQAGVLYDAHTQPCLHGLISRDSTQQKECPITVTKDTKVPLPVQTSIINRYALTTPNISYHYRCPQTSPRSGQLKAGLYIITVEPGCDMDARKWILKGREIKTFTTYSVSVPPVPVDISFVNHVNFSINLPPGVDEFEYESFHDLVKPRDSSMGARVKKIQKDIGKDNLTWLWVTVGITLGVATLLLTWRILTTKSFRRRFFNTLPANSSLTPNTPLTPDTPKATHPTAIPEPSSEPLMSDKPISLYPRLTEARYANTEEETK